MGSSCPSFARPPYFSLVFHVFLALLFVASARPQFSQRDHARTVQRQQQPVPSISIPGPAPVPPANSPAPAPPPPPPPTPTPTRAPASPAATPPATSPQRPPQPNTPATQLASPGASPSPGASEAPDLDTCRFALRRMQGILLFEFILEYGFLVIRHLMSVDVLDWGLRTLAIIRAAYALPVVPFNVGVLWFGSGPNGQCKLSARAIIIVLKNVDAAVGFRLTLAERHCYCSWMCVASLFVVWMLN